MTTRVDIHSLVLQGGVRSLQIELQRNPHRINEKDKVGYTVLHLAASKDGVDMLLFILSFSGVDIAICDREGKTALHCASAHGRTENAELLIENGADINCVAKNGWTALHCSCVNGKSDTSGMLIMKGALMKEDIGGYTPLYYAVRYNHEVCVATIVHLSNASDIQHVARDGKSALHICALIDNLNIIKVSLRANKITVDTVDEDGNTALHFACEKGHLDVAIELCTVGNASTKIKNKKLKRALEFLTEKSRKMILLKIEEHKRLSVKQNVSIFTSKIISESDMAFVQKVVQDSEKTVVNTKKSTMDVKNTEEDLSLLTAGVNFTNSNDQIDPRSSTQDSTEISTEILVEDDSSHQKVKDSPVTLEESDLLTIRQYAQTSYLLQTQVMRLSTKLQAHERALNTIVGKYKECPNLIWFYPKEKAFRDWLVDPVLRITQNPVIITFVCPVSLNIVKCGPHGTGWEVKNPKVWFKKWGPALLTTVKVLNVALVAGRLLTGIPIPMPNVTDLGLGCTDTPLILKSLKTAFNVVDSISSDVSVDVPVDAEIDQLHTTTSPGFSTLLDESYRQMHEFVVSPEANEGRSIVLEDHLRDSLTRVMSPVTGNIEWISPEYVELWLQREAASATPMEDIHIDIQNTSTVNSGDAISDNTVKIHKLEEEITALRKTVDNVVRTNANKKIRNSRDFQVYDICGNTTSSGLQQVQCKLQRTKLNGFSVSDKGQLDTEYINLLERSLVETQEQLLRLTTDFELFREDQQVSVNYRPQENSFQAESSSCTTLQRDNAILKFRDTCKEIDLLLTAGELILEGELAKISGNKYKSYYFVLTKKDLKYYAPSGAFLTSSLSFQRSIPLKNMQIRGVEIVHENLRNAFEIHSPEKSFYLEAPTSYSKNIWYQAISSSISSLENSGLRVKSRKIKHLSIYLNFTRCVDCQNAFGFFANSGVRCSVCLRCKCKKCFELNRTMEKWEAVTDPVSGRVYWWNRFTNETTALGESKPDKDTIDSSSVSSGRLEDDRRSDSKKVCLACATL